ncbi:hypothetical protein L596_005125 [Steinernema carpocapsae]|uniref:Helitron helicase-like domain-containing protein n=1 Tax=Steinernema carpocapsae TaxID=34508 RepID=A0A4U8V286_STECR|nr:hypothetical protein L596_005125 [Steinernema carpocapsae]
MLKGTQVREHRSNRRIELIVWKVNAFRSINRRSLEDGESQNGRLQAVRSTHTARVTERRGQTLCLARRVRVVDAHDIGLLDVACTACGALHFACEVISRNHGTFNDCCSLGKVSLDMTKFREFPEYLRRLLMREHPDKREERVFHENIRRYNGKLGFVSVNAKNEHFSNSGPYVYKIQGQIHHVVNLAAISDGGVNSRPSYGQLFIMDTNEAVDARTTADRAIDRNLMFDLETLMRTCNPFVEAYRMMYEVEQEALAASGENARVPEIKLLFNINAPDQNRYNLPRVNEVAAVFVSPDGNDNPPPAEIMMHPRGRDLTRLNATNAMCTPMSYPLFFVNGGFGWNPEMSYEAATGSRTRVTNMQWIQYMIADRRDFFNPCLYGGRLFQQFMVDNWVKVEQQRLLWQRLNQKTLKADCFVGLEQHLEQRAQEQGIPRGRTVILSSTFVGGDRYYQQAYQDAMAIVTEFGAPDLFITFTCNPKWPEIVSNLKPGQSPCDRPDLVVKVFQLKLKEFMDDILKKQVLGKVKAFVRVIEFQKRGLPHTHMLLILDDEHKFRTGADVDSVVCAELPYPATEPRLYSIVKSSMMHGPCGTSYRHMQCMQKHGDRCDKDFPKPYSEETVLEEDQKPRYRRRESAPHFVNEHGERRDSRWVVGYNPYLTLKYNAHVNVEVCTGIKCVKYLFKYVYKGMDKASLFICETGAVENEQQNPDVLNHDEVQNYADARYVGPAEACWRLLGYPMQETSHNVERLAIHLEGEQNIMFDEEEDHKSLWIAQGWPVQRLQRGLS